MSLSVRQILRCAAVGSLLFATTAIAQTAPPKKTDATKPRHANLHRESLLARLAPADLPQPQPPGRILGMDLAPGGPTTIELLPPSESQPAGLTLAELEGMALANNPTLVQANARIDAARGRWVQAGLLPNPNLGYAANEIGNNGAAGQQGGYIGQTVPLGGKLRLSRAVVEQEVRQAQWQRDAQQWMVLNDARIAFFDTLVAQRAVELTTRLLTISQESERTAADLLEIQQVSRVDFLQARIEARAARIEANNAMNHLDAAWRRLAAVVGLPCMERVHLLGDPATGIPTLDWHDSLCRILGASPELAAAQAAVGRARFAVERARVQRVPDFDAQYSPQHDTSTGFNVHNVQTTLNIPLFDRNQGNLRAAQAELTTAMREVDRIELDLQSRLASAFEEYSNARQQVAIYSDDILPDAQSSLDLVAAGYRQGEFSYLTLLTTQRTYFRTSLAYLSALNALRQSAIEIEGYLLTGSLGRPSDDKEPSISATGESTPALERIGQ